MFNRLPSLPALRTFEAACRLRSFKLAAEELGVTATAVSHQVRTLEDTLGVSLFARSTRSIAPTEAGEALAPVIHDALSRIKDGVEGIVSNETVVTITTTPAFASLVLAPNLGKFQAANPDLSIQLHTGTKPVDLSKERQIDLAVRYGFGGPETLNSVKLADEAFLAYGSPEYVRSLAGLKDAQLFETVWQQSILGGIDWNGWVEAADLNVQLRDLCISRFEEEHYGIQAAIAGQGLTLASSVLARDYLQRGLLAPYRPEVSLPGASYYALCVPQRSRAKKVRASLDWLTAIGKR